MTNDILRYIGRIILLTLLQVLIFKQLHFQLGTFNYIHVLIYPYAIITLPVRIPRNLLILIAFVMGMAIDVFYNSIGVHTSALVFTAFIRAHVLNLLEPRGGYNVNASPTRYYLGMNWFIRYLAIMVALHVVFYVSMDVFTFVYIQEIILKSFFSFIFSMVFILLYQFLFNPK